MTNVPEKVRMSPKPTNLGVFDEPSVETAVARIRARNATLCAFVNTRLERALEESAARRRTAARSPLHGIPYSLKDTWEVAGEVTTAGSDRYRARISEVDSPVHAVFEDAGAVLVGKTNLSDLMLVPESASYVGGIGKNPFDVTRTCGGSSGGAAAAVADGMSVFDWGSDVGGSIRMPAAYCGVFGLRLSSECWPMVGDFPKLPPSLAWMNGQGPITTSLSRMRDVLHAAAPLRTGRERAFSLRGAMLYADPKLFGEWPTFVEDVEPTLRKALDGLPVRRDHGLPPASRAHRMTLAMWASHFDDLLAADVLSLREGLLAVGSSLLFRGRFGDRRFHPHTAGVLSLVFLGRYSLYRNAQQAERDLARFRDDVAALWDRGHLLVAPTVAWSAPKHGRSFRNPQLQAYAMPGNAADATALAIPFGRFPNGMPRSLQIMGPPGSEQTVIDTAERFLRASRQPGIDLI